MKNCELKISFDRAAANCAVIAVEDQAELDKIEITDCFAITEYVSSPAIRSHFDQIEYNPTVYEYDEVEVIIKNIPQHETNIRFR